MLFKRFIREDTTILHLVEAFVGTFLAGVTFEDDPCLGFACDVTAHVTILGIVNGAASNHPALLFAELEDDGSFPLFPADLVITDDLPVENILLVVVVVLGDEFGEVRDAVLDNAIDIRIREIPYDIGVAALVFPVLRTFTLAIPVVGAIVFTNLSLNNEFHNDFLFSPYDSL